MLAASYWSLLDPAIEMAEESRIYGAFVFLPVSVGFAAGAVFVYLADILLPMLVSPIPTNPSKTKSRTKSLKK